MQPNYTSAAECEASGGWGAGSEWREANGTHHCYYWGMGQLDSAVELLTFFGALLIAGYFGSGQLKFVNLSMVPAST